MRKQMLAFAAIIVVVVVCVVAEQPEVTTNLGTAKGTTLQTFNGRPYHAFQGIPYAKPPVGKHRFKQSVPATAWRGILNATRIPNACMQVPHPFAFPNTPLEVIGSEDCLYLNVYTPKLPTELPDGKLLDVIFYIHGGAFQMCSSDMFGPEYLMDRDVVFVNMNYRLGVLGFFSLEDRTCPGNNGLKDQNLALRWVNKHIAAFGGNPNSITIVGTSAGGASVHYHVLSPLSKGLFHKAITNSGVVLNPWVITEKPREKSMVISQAVGCPTNDSILILECLRDRPAEQLVSSMKLLTVIPPLLPIAPLGPIIEQPNANAFIDQQPIDLIKSKSFNDVPILFSYTSDEGATYAGTVIADELAAKDVDEKWDELAPTILELTDVVQPARSTKVTQMIREHYLGNKIIVEAYPEFVRSISERWFKNGIQDAAILHAENQASPVYAYRFSYPFPDDFNPYANIKLQMPYEGRSYHGSDVFYYLNVDESSSRPLTNSTEAVKMSKTMIDYYLNFITQTPVPSWQTVKSGLPEFKFMDIVSNLPAENKFKVEKPSSSSLWNTLKLLENSAANLQGDLHTEL